MPSISSQFSAYLTIGRTAILQAICYPADVVIEFISYPIAFIGYFYFALALPSHATDPEGASLAGLITYFSVGWVLRMIFDQGIDGELAGDVHSGNVALRLVRPMSLDSYLFAEFVGLGIARVFYYGLPAMLFIGLLFGDQIHINPSKLVWFVPFVLIAFRLAFELQYMIGILAFFVVVNQHIAWSVDMLVRLVSGLIVPLHFFPAGVATALQLLPFQYLYYKPIEALLSVSDPARFVADVGVGLFWLWCARAANRRLLSLALRRHVNFGS